MRSLNSPSFKPCVLRRQCYVRNDIYLVFFPSSQVIQLDFPHTKIEFSTVECVVSSSSESEFLLAVGAQFFRPDTTLRG